MKIALVRHGGTEWNRLGRLQGVSDIPLSGTGRRRARETAKLLARDDWHAVVSSPLARAKGTATIISDHVGSPFERTYSDLMERDFGEYEGSDSDAALQPWPELDVPGVESRVAVAERGARALRRIATDHSSCDVVVVCHSFLITHTLGRRGGADLSVVPHGGIVYVEVLDGEWNFTGTDNPSFSSI